MPDPSKREISVGGVSTHVISGGSGAPLLYLHGVAPFTEWLPLHDLLGRRFTVYVPDHPGFGKTARPDWLTGMDDLVLHYEELVRALGLERPAVVGFSLGGWIAAELAVAYPDRISALVLLNAAGLHLDESLIPDLPALSGEDLVRTVFHDPAAGAAFLAARNSPEQRLDRYRALTTLALLAWNPWFNPKLARRLRRITSPTLALWADGDRLITPAYGAAYRDAIPGAQLQLLEECGHMAPVEAPAAVAASILGFLDGTAQEAAA